MSEPKLISPLLDHFVMGQPISEHHGVRCCPAMTKKADKRYIVKIISIPASQVQLDALLLAGAYSSKMAALSYFRELAEGIEAEAEILKKLSRFEGFVPYEDLQIIEMDEGQIGYEVYLLSPYKRSLERHMRKHPMTHLKAVNLGLDLCASMVMCRRAGYLYVDLKPGNIYINEKNEYCIGDLGFVALDSLKYASLPDKYRSAYTAPELDDPWAALNETVDTYAIGMILYQIYNDGKLPEGSEPAAPIYADYEMAEIILKAIAADPEQRWKDPMEMGQALVAYMQRNSVNDVSIVPLPGSASEVSSEIPVEPEADPVDEAPAAPEEEPASAADAAPADGDEGASDSDASDEPDAEPASAPEAPATAEEPAPEDPGVEDPEPPVFAEEAPAEPDTAEPADPSQGEDAADLTFLDSMVHDDTTPDENTAGDIAYSELSEDTSDILAQADELLALDSLEPVVAPEPIDIPMPAPIPPEAINEPAAPPAEALAQDSDVTLAGEPEDPQPEPEPAAPPAEPEPAPDAEDEDGDEEDPVPPAPKKKGNIVARIALILALLLLLGAVAFGCHYYNTEYLQTIDKLTIQGSEDSMTVTLDTQIDDALLTVVCTDSYGNTFPASVQDHIAVFTGLNPDTIYKVSVSIDGFHALRGNTSGTYTTPAQTNIVHFSATAGAEPGSVILTFTVEGKDTNSWNITYSAPGEAERTESFSGHILTVSNLAAGKEYTFRLSSEDDLYMIGNDTVTFTISAPVFAENLAITQSTLDGLTAVWTVPAGAEGTLWSVRCYSDSGYDQTIETSDTTVTFTDIDPSQGYTVEVTAQGMSSGVMTHISGRSATITNTSGDTSTPLTLKASWEFEGDAPQNGWLVAYEVEGSGVTQTMLVSDSEISIYPAMPGDVYLFTVQAADGTTVFNNTFSCTAGPVRVFSGYGVTADNMSFRMCRTPSYSNWSWTELSSSAYTATFEVGEKASFVVQLNASYNTSDDYIDVLFVIRNDDEEIVCTSSTGASWTYLWDGRYCELDIPTMPTEPGKYSVNVYFNGMAAARDFFTIE